MLPRAQMACVDATQHHTEALSSLPSPLLPAPALGCSHVVSRPEGREQEQHLHQRPFGSAPLTLKQHWLPPSRLQTGGGGGEHHTRVCVCVCACARVYACVCVCVCACVLATWSLGSVFGANICTKRGSTPNSTTSSIGGPTSAFK